MVDNVVGMLVIPNKFKIRKKQQNHYAKRREFIPKNNLSSEAPVHNSLISPRGGHPSSPPNHRHPRIIELRTLFLPRRNNMYVEFLRYVHSTLVLDLTTITWLATLAKPEHETLPVQNKRNIRRCVRVYNKNTDNIKRYNCLAVKAIKRSWSWLTCSTVHCNLDKQRDDRCHAERARISCGGGRTTSYPLSQRFN